ncbi:hypothetical protein ACFOWB_13270 [Chenggangzhangella methanolivorans]
MTAFSSKVAKTVAALVAVSTLALAAAPAAQAGGWHGHHRHHGYGYGAAALGGGLLLGALIASNSRPAYGYARDCWIERQKRYDAYGNRYFKPVKVCD